jgi:putative transcriptional regulator
LAHSPSFELEIRGALLIAHPHLAGDFFDRTVIYVLEHDEQGSFGFVINQLSDLMLCELIESAHDQHRARQVHIGGPVGLDHLYFLHPVTALDTSNPTEAGQNEPSTRELTCAASDQAPPADPFIPLLGYAGWGPGQLEHEISADVWLLAPATLDLIFHRPADAQYDASLASLGLLSGAIPPMQSKRQ